MFKRFRPSLRIASGIGSILSRGIFIGSPQKKLGLLVNQGVEEMRKAKKLDVIAKTPEVQTMLQKFEMLGDNLEPGAFSALLSRGRLCLLISIWQNKVILTLKRQLEIMSLPTFKSMLSKHIVFFQKTFAMPGE
jgi:hypothetical protein